MKKIIALLLALCMVFALVACGGDPVDTNTGSANTNTGDVNTGDTGATNDKPLAGTYDIKVWVAEAIVELTKTQIDNFNATNEDGIVINATIEAVGEGEAATQMTNDVEAGADIYCFAQDQAARLIQAGALAKLGVAAAEIVSAANDPGVVAAAMSGGEMWAYPLTSDNGYFMYYDKSVISEDQIDSMEALIAACEAAGRTFTFELEGSAWYAASFFFATGCESTWTTDADGTCIDVYDTFNSPEGLIAVKGMQKLVTSSCYNNASQTASFEAAIPAAVVISGTWDYDTAAKILGDNLGVTDLPSFEVDGNSYHLGSYNGCKLMGVKPQVDAVKAAALHKLAQYLTSEEAQRERFNAQSWGPANLNAQKDEAVQSNPGLKALLEQAPYSVPQGQIHGSWWDIAKVIATGVKEATDDAALQATLDAYSASIAGLFNMSEEVLNAYTVIGSINGDGWTQDLPMTEQADGTWKSDEAYTMDAGVEFKCRQGKNWDVAFPAENYVVENAGTYYIVLDPVAGTVTLVEG